MIGALARKLFGSSNERRIKAFQPRVNAVNALERYTALRPKDQNALAELQVQSMSCAVPAWRVTTFPAASLIAIVHGRATESLAWNRMSPPSAPLTTGE